MVMVRHILLSEKLPSAELIQKLVDEPLIMLDAFKGCVRKGALSFSESHDGTQKNMKSEPDKILNG